MTEKEFEQLKTGDKVWIFLSEPKETVVIAKQKDIGSNALSVQVDRNGVSSVYNGEYVYVTKAEAWEAEIKYEEKFVENNERVIEEAKERIERCKAELAKAKEDEKEVWVADVYEGTVVRSTKRRWEGSAENYEWSLGSPRYKLCDTEQEAYEALAEYYKGKYEEALAKAGKTMWYIASDDSIVMITNAHLREACICEGVNYDGNIEERRYNCHSLFSSRQEAEAELERRKRNDKMD